HVAAFQDEERLRRLTLSDQRLTRLETDLVDATGNELEVAFRDPGEKRHAGQPLDLRIRHVGNTTPSYACGTMTGTVEAGRMAQVNLDNALESGRDAVRRHAWREAFERLTAADQAGGLNAADLEALAYAAWWSGHAQACISARERGDPLHLEAGRPRRAALVALTLAKGHFEQRGTAVGMAWLSRAE